MNYREVGVFFQCLFQKYRHIYFLAYTVDMYYEVLIGSKYYHGFEPLTYSSSKELSVGQLVRIPLRNKPVVGIILRPVSKPTFKCLEIIEPVDVIIPQSQLKLIEWLRSYYPAPLGSIVDLFIPKLPRKVIYPTPLDTSPQLNNTKLPTLTQEQLSVVKRLDASTEPIILHGITGSGKTRVYLEQALKTIAEGKSVILLSPEIGLSKHLEKRFKEVVPDDTVLVIHSNLTDKVRRETWLRLHAANQPQIVIGARSALFVPLNNIGLIILDEFHDSAYKQEQSPNYQTSRVAAQLAAITSAKLILGSATPPVADYAAFQQRNLPIIEMLTTAVDTAVYSVDKQFVDLSDPSQLSRVSFLSTPLLESIQESLSNGEQSMIFLNRRGTARVIACETCGWRATCPKCDVGQTYHGDKQKLICHSCGLVQPLPYACPECGAHDLVFTIAGTKTLEAELIKQFPHARIHRLDRDTTSENSISNVLEDIESGAIDIIIGTQSIVKGFDLKKLSTVGIIYADASLQIADYTSVERTYQLIAQVSGRLGRGHRSGRLILQTYQPDSDVFKWALAADYKKLATYELKHRKKYHFPPYMYILKIIAKRSTEQSAKQALIDLVKRLPEHSSLDISMPSPCYPQKIAGTFRWQLIIKSKHRTNLVQIIKQLPKNYSYDLDPNTLL